MTRCDLKTYGECACQAGECHQTPRAITAPVHEPSIKLSLAIIGFGLSMMAIAFISLSALDRMIPEADDARPVLHDVRCSAPTTLDLRIVERRIDIQLPVNLFRLPGHVAVQTEQVVPNNTLHAGPFRAAHYRDRVTSQLRVAA